MLLWMGLVCSVLVIYIHICMLQECYYMLLLAVSELHMKMDVILLLLGVSPVV